MKVWAVEGEGRCRYSSQPCNYNARSVAENALRFRTRSLCTARSRSSSGNYSTNETTNRCCLRCRSAARKDTREPWVLRNKQRENNAREGRAERSGGQLLLRKESPTDGHQAGQGPHSSPCHQECEFASCGSLSLSIS